MRICTALATAEKQVRAGGTSTGHKAKDINVYIIDRRDEERSVEKGSASGSALRGGERAHRQSDDHWKCCKGNNGGTSEKPERIWAFPAAAA